MQIRLTTANATATAIYNVVSDKVRNLVATKRTFTVEDANKLKDDLKTRTFAKLMLQMMLNDPMCSSEVNISIIKNDTESNVEDILDEILSQQEEKSVEKEPNYDDVIDPNTADFS